MALLRDEVYHATTATREIFDPLRSRQVELAAFDGVTSLSNAINQARASLPATRTLDGVSVPLARVSARRIRNDRTLVRALYSFLAGGGTNEGFDQIHLQTGYETIRWVQTTRTSATFPNAFDAFGMPAGEPYFKPTQDHGKVIASYLLQLPVWHIRVRTILSFNPAGAVGVYQQAPLNDGPVTWDEFSILDQSIRFDRAAIAYRGAQYYVSYLFTVRQGPWTEQVALDNHNFVTNVMYNKRSYTDPGFPVSDD